MSNEYLKDLQFRLSKVIKDTCNTLGCDNCDLKWDDGCSATDLQGKIHDEELQEMVQKNNSTPSSPSDSLTFTLGWQDK